MSSIIDENRPAGEYSGQTMPDTGKTRSAPFVFSGMGSEYFGIWIVNIILSIITFGIYSAWAKVRNKRYFYGNTELDKAVFEYTANPVRILIGRVIAAFFFILYFAAEQFSVMGGIAAWLLLIIFIPWAVRQSLRFNARNSRYRNVAFSFNGSLKESYLVFILYPFLAFITAGIMFPYAVYRQQAYIYNNHMYGTTGFSFNATAGHYYKMFLRIIGVIIFFIALGMILFLMNNDLFMITAIPVIITANLLIIAMYNVRKANIKFNNTVIADHAFESDWSVWSYMKMYAGNTIGILLTLGLFIPWAKIRKARYAAKHTRLRVYESLDRFAAAEEDRISAVGEGIGDLFDLDMGI